LDITLNTFRLLALSSQVAVKGQQYIRKAFNIYGHSPLVSKYMLSTNAEACNRAAASFLVERTELDSDRSYPSFYRLVSWFVYSAALVPNLG